MANLVRNWATTLLWAVYLALLGVLLPQTTWALGQYGLAGASSVALVPQSGPVDLGVTTYSADDGKSLACNGHTYNELDEWVAVPIEWILGGPVGCGDLVQICYDDGRCLDALPAWDTGCMLHYPVWDTGRPMGIDVPLHVTKKYGLRTQTAQVMVWSITLQEWLELPLLAWDEKHCNGPLTEGVASLPYMPY